MMKNYELNKKLLFDILKNGKYKISFNFLFNKDNFTYDELVIILDEIYSSKIIFIVNFKTWILDKHGLIYNKDFIFKDSYFDKLAYSKKNFNKHRPIFKPVIHSIKNKEDAILGTFDYETISYKIDAGIVNKLEHNEIVPFIISYILWIDDFSIINDPKVLKFYDDKNFTSDSLKQIHKDKIIIWFEDLFIIMEKYNKKNIFIWAHNFSSFDGLIIKNIVGLLSDKYEVNILIKDNKIYSLTVTFNNRKIRFYCSILLLNFSLKNLRKSFQLDNKKIFFPHDLFIDCHESLWYDLNTMLEKIHKYNYSEEDINNFKENWILLKCNLIHEYFIEYCKLDTIVLKNVLTSFFIKYNNLFNDNISYTYFITASRLSLYTFLNKNFDFYNNDIKSISSKSELDKFIRVRYFGGRCEIFKGWNNKGDISYYDFPGIYSIAISFKLPIGEPQYYIFNPPITDKNTIDSIFKNLDDKDYLAFISVKTYSEFNSSYIPTLPIKKIDDKITTKLIYCFGNNNCTYFSEELKMFIKNGGVVKEINEIVVFKSGYPLKIYSEFNLKGKNESKINKDKIIETLFKLLNNSLYGKFAIVEPDTRFVIYKHGKTSLSNIIHIKDRIILDENCLLLEIYDSKNKWYLKDNAKINVAIGAAISSYGRIILTQSIINVKEMNKDADLIYCDTDRIYWDSKEDIKCDNIYNNLKWETQEKYKDALFISSKIYWLKDFNDNYIIKSKGVKTKNVTIEQINILKDGKRTITVGNNLQWIKFNKFIPITRNITKTFRPFLDPKRSLVIENDIWNGYTVSFINNIKSTSHEILIDKIKIWSIPYESYVNTLNDSTLKQYDDLLNNIDIINLIRVNEDLPNFKFYRNIWAINHVIIDVAIFDFKYYYENGISINKILEDFYWFIFHLWNNKRLTNYSSIGIILNDGHNFITISPVYLNYTMFKIIGPYHFSLTLNNKIDYINEAYLSNNVKFEEAVFISTNFELRVRFI